jgi:hypothetical protein
MNFLKEAIILIAVGKCSKRGKILREMESLCTEWPDDDKINTRNPVEGNAVSERSGRNEGKKAVCVAVGLADTNYWLYGVEQSGD